MAALRMAGKRELIPKYNQLPQTEKQTQQLLIKANLWTTFVCIDIGFVISGREAGGISELSALLRKLLYQKLLKEEQELKEFYEDEHDEDEEEDLLEDWKRMEKFRRDNF